MPSDKSNEERVWVMTRCPSSGSVYTCHCEPRFTDVDAGPDYSCAGEGLPECEATYVAVDALLSDEAIDRALRASIRLDRLGDTMEVEIAVQDPRNRDSMRRALRAAIAAALPGTEKP